MRAHWPQGSFVVIGISCFLACMYAACGVAGPTTESSAESSVVEFTQEQNRQEQPQDRVADASVSEAVPEARDEVKEAATPEPSRCELAQPTDNLSVVQGGRLFLSAETRPAGGSVTIIQRPQTWVALYQEKEQRWLVRTDYSTPGAYLLEVELACGGVTTMQSLKVTVTGLSWGRVPAWAAGTEGPAQREHPRIWIDPKDPDTLWLWGGLLFVPRQFTPAHDVWKLDIPSGKWSKTTDANGLPMVTTAHVAQAPDSTSVLVYGGDQNGIGSPKLFEFQYGSTPGWTEYKEDSWAPNAGTLGSLIYDPIHKRYVSACGINQQSQGYDIHCRVSLFDPAAAAGKRWSEWKTTEPAPTGRYGFAYAYDQEKQRLLLFSGAQQPVSQQNPINPARDVWALELKDKIPAWTKISTSGEMLPGRRNGCFALDPEGHRLFMFGGTADGRTVTPGLFALHLDPGQERWHRVDTTDAPATRASCIGIYDAKRKQILFGFGNNTQGIFADFHGLQLGN